MKLKLSNNELNALAVLVINTAQKYQIMMNESALDMEGKLYKALFEEMMISFQQKLLMRQEKYSMKLRPSWAIAFHIEFSGIVDRQTYHGNLAQMICDKIHQQYS